MAVSYLFTNKKSLVYIGFSSKSSKGFRKSMRMTAGVFLGMSD